MSTAHWPTPQSKSAPHEPQEAYPLDPADLPGIFYFDDLARGVVDTTGSTTAYITGTSVSGYDALWLRLEGEVMVHGKAHFQGENPMGPGEIIAYFDREAATRLHNTLGALVAEQQQREQGSLAGSAHKPSAAYPANDDLVSSEIDPAGLEAGIADTTGATNIALIPLSDPDEDTIALRLRGDCFYADHLQPQDLVVGQAYPGDGAAHLDIEVAQTLHTTLDMLIARMREG